MTIEVVTNLIILLTSQIGFIYGFFTILIRRQPLYLKMVVLVMACMMVSRIYVILQFITKGDDPDVFHVGMLGMLGCFLFLFSANFGMIDSLTDDGDKEFIKYRIISWLAPVLIIAGFVPVCFFGGTISKNVSYAVVVLFVALASRYHLKHLIFPDVDYGVVRCIRGYNAVALVLCLAVTVFISGDILSLDIVILISGIVMSICCIVIVPLIKKEASKWTTA